MLVLVGSFLNIFTARIGICFHQRLLLIRSDHSGSRFLRDTALKMNNERPEPQKNTILFKENHLQSTSTLGLQQKSGIILRKSVKFSSAASCKPFPPRFLGKNLKTVFAADPSQQFFCCGAAMLHCCFSKRQRFNNLDH